jgi:Na+/H+ antiporter NhaA
VLASGVHPTLAGVGEAFPAEADFQGAKIVVFAASILSAVIGVTALLLAGRSAPL